MISKEDFVKLYFRPKITILFNEFQFLSNSTIMLEEHQVKVKEIGDYYCPWYYDAETGKEYKVGFEEILNYPQARAVKIKQARSNRKITLPPDSY